jgi:hypothetical protein
MPIQTSCPLSSFSAAAASSGSASPSSATARSSAAGTWRARGGCRWGLGLPPLTSGGWGLGGGSVQLQAVKPNPAGAPAVARGGRGRRLVCRAGAAPQPRHRIQAGRGCGGRRRLRRVVGAGPREPCSEDGGTRAGRKGGRQPDQAAGRGLQCSFRRGLGLDGLPHLHPIAAPTTDPTKTLPQPNPTQTHPTQPQPQPTQT